MSLLRSAPAEGSKRSIIVDALPDLVIGVVGLPVAIAAQKVAESIFSTVDRCTSHTPLLAEKVSPLELAALPYLLGVYILYAVMLLVLLDHASSRQAGTSITALLLIEALLAVLLVIFVILLGQMWNSEWQPLFVPLSFVVLILVPLGGGLRTYGSLFHEHPKFTSVYYLFLFVCFILASLLLVAGIPLAAA